MNEKQKNEIAIRCEGLTRHYGSVKAVSELTLSIPHGAIFGFLGRNGAGKTTTIRLLTGLAHPTAGRAWIDGMEITNGNSSAREKYGYLPQDPAFYNWMTPVEYLDYVSRLFLIPTAERKTRIREMLERVGLSDAAHRRIGGFSGGMHQRLGIAQALIHRPPVLLLDEPTSALDPAGRYEVLELIDSLRGTVTIFLSSHILADVERVCDTIGVIHQGRLLFVEEREQLLQKYAVNAMRIELDANSTINSEELKTLLETQTWVNSITTAEKGFKILVNDTMQAKKEILPILVNCGAILTHYEWVKPSLEEVFLQVSS